MRQHANADPVDISSTGKAKNQLRGASVLRGIVGWNANGRTFTSADDCSLASTGRALTETEEEWVEAVAEAINDNGSTLMNREIS